MIRHAIILVSAIVAIAVWAYGVNYKTMTALERVSALRAEIADEREALQILRVEWAYLNAPERLKRLVAQHQSELRLVPLVPEHLQTTSVVPFPSGESDAPVALAPTMPLPVGRPVSLAAR